MKNKHCSAFQCDEPEYPRSRFCKAHFVGLLLWEMQEIEPTSMKTWFPV